MLENVDYSGSNLDNLPPCRQATPSIMRAMSLTTVIQRWSKSSFLPQVLSSDHFGSFPKAESCTVRLSIKP